MSAFAPENLEQMQQDVAQDVSGLVDQAVDNDVVAITTMLKKAIVF